MRAAVWPRERPGDARLLHLDPGAGRLADRRLPELPELLRPGDLVVVNDAGTLPASLSARGPNGPLELRLAGPPDPCGRWPAVAFGSGGWRQRTEDRPLPARLRAGDTIDLAHGLRATVAGISALSPRLVELRFAAGDEALWPLLYRAGRPVQYSHLVGPLALWHVQTPVGARPWAVELPSASRAFSPGLLRSLRSRDVAVASVTHAAGLSATGDPALDAALPLPERYAVGEPAVAAIETARRRGGRVLAAGTSVVRALEGWAQDTGGVLRTGEAVTSLRLCAATKRRVADGLLTGLHEPGTSHFELLRAFATEAALQAAHRHAQAEGYVGHEFGDYALLLAA